MRNLLMICAFVTFAGLSPISSFSQVYQGTEAQRYNSDCDLVYIKENSPIPSFLRLSNNTHLEVHQCMEWMKKSFGLHPDLGMLLIDEHKDKLGFIHYRYQQTYKNIPIEGAVYILHAYDGYVISMNGRMIDRMTANWLPAITEENALDHALNMINAEKYMWMSPGEEHLLQQETGNPEATYFPSGELVYLPKGGDLTSYEYVLAYKFNIYASAPLYRANVYVGASTGTILFEDNLIHVTDANGTAVTKYSGTRSIITDSIDVYFRLRESGRGNGIETWDMNKGTNYNSAVDFTDGDNYWNNVNANKDEVATDAHWGTEMTYDYFWINHGRNSIDNNGFKLRSYVHYGNNYSNAFWDGQRMTYGDGSGAVNPFTSLDIAAHEITHGLTSKTAGLIYSYESGALNESFSDIFGTSIEFYGKPAMANWLLGDDIGYTIRSMSNPKAKGDPDTYLGVNWHTAASDNGGVHTNSGVQNFWYYLLVNGGSGTNDNGDSYNITGLGFTKASEITFRNLTVYLYSSSQYADARFNAIQSAIDLFGPCTPEVIATTNAWYAVGVGDTFSPTVTSNFTAAPLSSCVYPVTVEFTNKSNNAGSFVWDFGDGNTSTAVNPSHVYNSYGTFAVQLIADGGSCGVDTIIQVGYVTVDSSLPCLIEMPTTGTGAVQLSCVGILYDDGGPLGNYSNNTNGVITIEPPGASSIALTFSTFDFEVNYDYLFVYDGPTINSPLIGNYTGNTLPNGGVINSSSGAVTIRQYSDMYLTGTGFTINWNCSYPTSTPIPDFTVDDSTSCTGIVQFMDLSTNGPISWKWDFGDGSSSSLQNPDHTYLINGVYSVKLTVTNSFGDDSLIKNSYVLVSKPAAPNTTPDSSCGPASLTLSATGTGDLHWFDVPMGGTLLDTGSTYVTPYLTTTKYYYVENIIVPSSQYVGPTDNSFGTGANYQGNRYLIFDCFTPLTLVSVLVYAQGGANRTIELRNNLGSVLHDTTLYIQDGATRITLNFDIPIGNDLQMGITGNPNMYRNNTGANYPYTLPGYLSITGCNAPAAYYYFFYDWEVKEPKCKSERAKVTAGIDYNDPSAAFSHSANGLMVFFTDQSINGVFNFWDFGDGNTSNLIDPVHVYSAQGTYGIYMISYNGCGSDTTAIEEIFVRPTFISDNRLVDKIKVYPNPVSNTLSLQLSNFPGDDLLIRMVSITGEVVFSEHLSILPKEYLTTEDMSPYSKGFYLLQLISDQEIVNYKIILQ